ncbi:ribonuclease H family protein [Colwellia sp. 6_MG-2023]|uniref:ribonuclease H family protein n=1 Tax=Colwellia sp. 6_MG-2023 TaxID=3062676 RepID=UPI0026E24F78|nr:ribonuclease H family protein [Colwellia sp. 6_MG-2023]MDO6488710.1 ribonuclease H family protein [Colwellia sp. 6_MG-2023]
MSKKFYVIWKGAKTGIFSTWVEVQNYTQGRSDAQFMGFPSKAEAEAAFASTYTKALMKRSLANKGAASNKVKATSGATSKKSPTSNNNISAHGLSNSTAEIQIYCDGACSPNPGKSGTGIAIYQQGKIAALYYGLFQANGTNNTAELNGLLYSFKLAKKYLTSVKQVQILSDSKYSIDCITKWAKGWQVKGWTRGKGEEIKNLELIKECFTLYQEIKQHIIITHVKGHANIEGNELSDRMAVLARLQKQETLVKYQGELDIKTILAMESG